MARKFAEIVVRDGLDELSRHYVAAHRLPLNRLHECMRALASRHLTEEETINSFITRHKGIPSRLPFLEITRQNNDERRQTTYFCGEDKVVTAPYIRK